MTEWEVRVPGYLRDVERQMAAPSPSAPQEIRQQLPPGLMTHFDVEWVSALEQAKATRDLGDLYELVTKWELMVRAARRQQR